MIKRIVNIENLQCKCFYIGSLRVVYMLIPIGIDANEMENIAQQHQANLVIISGMDWNNDLTPWIAPGLKPQEAMFGGNAKQFLALLLNMVVPTIEAQLSAPIVNRTLLGTSLSGLFALWAWSQCNVFTSIGSLSGSFWYDGFAEWFCKQPIVNQADKIYLLLGDKEAKSKAPRFGEVNAKTQIIVDYLRRNNINVRFEYNQGNHFAPIIPRIDSALSFLLQ